VAPAERRVPVGAVPGPPARGVLVIAAASGAAAASVRAAAAAWVLVARTVTTGWVASAGPAVRAGPGVPAAPARPATLGPGVRVAAPTTPRWAVRAVPAAAVATAGPRKPFRYWIFQGARGNSMQVVAFAPSLRAVVDDRGGISADGFPLTSAQVASFPAHITVPMVLAVHTQGAPITTHASTWSPGPKRANGWARSRAAGIGPTCQARR
jgi:hypothetical protein